VIVDPELVVRESTAPARRHVLAAKTAKELAVPTVART